MNYISKSAALFPFAKATSPVVVNSIRSIPTPVVLAESSIVTDHPKGYYTNYSLSTTLPTGRILAKSGGIGGFAVNGQYRAAHTDVKVPNFDYYRRSDTKNPAKSSKENKGVADLVSYIPVVAAGIMATYSAKHIVLNSVQFWQPNADTLCVGQVKIKMDQIPEGVNMTFKWRGKPVFVKHRTKTQIDREVATPLSSLRDPQHDNDRVQDPKWLVVVGVCTHLGCVPIADAGDFHGYYCPCHGSHYDGSGRVRAGPAPTNLEVPFYVIEDNIITVGKA